MSKSRMLVLASGLLVLACIALVGRAKYRAQQQLFFPKHGAVKLPAGASGLSGASDVELQGGGAKLRGWYVASTNGAAVILGHGAGGNRADLMPEAKELVAQGFGVLMFDWPGHGESSGEIHWNEGERASLRAAIDWLSNRPEVERGRIGGYGFSMGGYVVAQVAALDNRLSAVVLAGTPANQRQQVHFQHGRWWLLGELPALLALQRGGMDLDHAMPIDEISKLAPRPVLIVAGTQDPIVPPDMAPALYARAGEPKQLLMVQGAGHGRYASVQGSPYLDTLSAFFRHSLLGART